MKTTNSINQEKVRPLRIALLLEYPIDLQGGVSVLVRALAKELSENHEVLLVSPDSSESILNSPDSGYFSGHYSLGHGEAMPCHVSALTQWLKAQRCDLAHFHLGGSYAWNVRNPFRSPLVRTRLAGIPCVSTVHLVVSSFDFCGKNVSPFRKIALFPLAWMAKILQLLSVDFEIAVSEHDLKKLKKWYFPCRGKFRRVYHSRLPMNVEYPAAHRTEKNILSVGHIAFRKGQHVLAQAFGIASKKYPGWNLLLAGHIAEEECAHIIEQVIPQLPDGSAIKLLGARDDVMSMMNAAAIFVQPSRYEALGLALQEALRYGCPVIGTKVGGIPELIRNGINGLLVPCDDPPAMAQALEMLMGDESLRRRFSTAVPDGDGPYAASSVSMALEYLELYFQGLARSAEMNRQEMINPLRS
jgi:glycosyltransferase involved in cell wall biosynthesis